MFRKLCVATFVLALPVLFFAQSTRAGAIDTEQDVCANTSTGGYCYGTMPAFRSDSHSSTVATFWVESENGTTTGYFYGVTAAGGSSCVAPAAMLPLWMAAVNHRGDFWVSWDASGNCSFVELEESSAYAE